MLREVKYKIAGIRALPVFPETKPQEDFGPSATALKQAAEIYAEPNHPQELHQIRIDVIDPHGNEGVICISSHKGELHITVTNDEAPSPPG